MAELNYVNYCSKDSSSSNGSIVQLSIDLNFESKVVKVVSRSSSGNGQAGLPCSGSALPFGRLRQKSKEAG